MKEIGKLTAEGNIYITYEIETAGLGHDKRMLFEPGPGSCGEIRDGVIFSVPSFAKGFWVFSFDDLVQMYELAKQARENKNEEVSAEDFKEALIYDKP